MKLTKQNIFTISAVVIILAVVVLRLTGVSGATSDFSVVSSNEAGHGHIVVISGRDIDRPPKDRVITTSRDRSVPHTHTIVLSESDYRSIKAGGEIIIPSIPSTQDNHTHTFAIKIPASG